MKPSVNRPRLLLCLLPILLLTACGQKFAKPSIEPKPPKQDCAERRVLEPVPTDAPFGSTDWREWAAYSVRLLGWGTQHVDARADSADCGDTHRKAGDIR